MIAIVQQTTLLNGVPSLRLLALWEIENLEGRLDTNVI